MKRFTMFFLIFCLCIFTISTASAARDKETPLKIGVIDIQRIMKNSNAARDAQAEFNKELQIRKDKLSAHESEIRTMEADLKKSGKKLSAQERNKRAEKLSKAVKDLKRIGNDMEEELRQKNAELSKKILEDVRLLVKNVFEKENFTIILERGVVVIADDSIDITDKVIQLYDAQKK